MTALGTEMDSSPGFRLARRGHVADDVYDQLAEAIVRGEIAVGATLPPERVLAERFGTSRIIARQAIHRLEEIGLVRCRQGGATVVLDPAAAGDIRLIGLLYRHGPSTPDGARGMRDMVEKQNLQGLTMVEIASRRAAPAALREILAFTDEYIASDKPEARFAAFEERFWRALAGAGGNRILMMEVAWWYRILGESPRVPQVAAAPFAIRVGFYREVARRLVDRDAAVQYYLAVVTPILDGLGKAFGVEPVAGRKNGIAANDPRASSRRPKRKNTR